MFTLEEERDMLRSMLACTSDRVLRNYIVSAIRRIEMLLNGGKR